MSTQTVPTITMTTDMDGKPWPPSKCCALDCGDFCQIVLGIELPFCERHMKDEQLIRAWNEL